MATSPIVENPAKRRNVPAAPSAWMSDKNVKLTMRLAHQFETAAMPPPIPLNLNGPNTITASTPILLGHPSENHTRFCSPHTALTSFVSARHAPGRCCTIDIRGIKISLTCSVSTEAEGVNVVNWRSGGSCLIENSGESEEANDDCNKG
ncbi:hypothetical protein Ahy_A01g000985 isoform G [Arachis hypogaea]|uniref:Uncharacterized protein n=1 Tax=Arachis hypogaea TaxID=3818 RepID=A0A445ELT2_ARAHY|nr:hypothetical protein Ahy_A01g000985 isoform G [Arachis hypogaea]